MDPSPPVDPGALCCKQRLESSSDSPLLHLGPSLMFGPLMGEDEPYLCFPVLAVINSTLVMLEMAAIFSVTLYYLVH